MHREINVRNILLNPRGEIQFTDFGSSALISQLCSYWTPEVSHSCPYWLPPEMFDSGRSKPPETVDFGCSMKSDIWSFGILALELAQGRPPLSGIDHHLSPYLTKKINERFFIRNYKTCTKRSKSFSGSFKDLVKQCLEYDPGNRPTVERLQKHGFFRRCKPPFFLATSMLNDLIGLEYRFTLSTGRMEGGEGEGEREEQNEEARQCRISGWKLNVQSLELSPILIDVPLIDLRETRRQVRFGGEIRIEEKEVITEDEVEEEEEGEGEDEVHKKKWDEFVSEQFERVSVELSDVSQQMDELSSKTSIDEIMETLHFARTNLEEQLERVKDLIITHRGELPVTVKEKVKVPPPPPPPPPPSPPPPTPKMQMDGQLFRELLERNIKLNLDIDRELDRVNQLFSQKRGGL